MSDDHHWESDTDTVESPVSRGQRGPAALFQLFGEAPGRVINLRSPRTFIGRESSSSTGGSVQIPHPSVSRQHAVVITDDEGLSVRDLGSTNGTFVNGHRIDAMSVRHGDRVKFGRTEFKVLIDPDLQGLVVVELRRLARLDPLTQVLNRETFLEELRLRLQAGQATVLVGMVNDFGALLKQYPGVATDHLLCGLGQVLSKRVADDHHLGRIGEATFAVLIPSGSDVDPGREAASLARHVAATSFRLEDNPIPLTLTFGTASQQSGITAEDLIASALEEVPRQLLALD